MTATATTRRSRKNQGRKDSVKASIKDLALLGEIITWSVNQGTTRTHKDVIAALESAELETGIARELLPRHAFARACKTLGEERAIDIIRDDTDYILFQFTSKTLSAEEWTYAKEATLRLYKETGAIESRSPSLKAKAESELARCTVARTTSDITNIVQRLFEKHADLFPVRDQGGAYFVPTEHTAFISKIEAFLGKLSGKVNRFPIPAGTERGNRAVQEVIAESMHAAIKEHTEAIELFNVNTHKDTIEAAAEKINTSRVKIEAYAHYLESQREDLLKALDAAKDQLAAKIESLSEGFDAFGCKLGTRQAEINKAITSTPQTVNEILEAAGLREGLKGAVWNHCNAMVEAGHVVKIDKKYKLAK